MKLPFNANQFFELFSSYNVHVFPVQIIFLLFTFGALYFIYKNKKYGEKVVLSALGILWIWTGLIYFIIHFSKINPPAYVFGGLFILQGLLFLTYSFTQKIQFDKSNPIYKAVGVSLVITGAVIYPIISYFHHMSFETIISIGLPCPTVIITLGFLFLFGKNIPKHLYIIPSIWSVFGISAAFNFHIWQDLIMIIAAIFTNFYIRLNTKEQ